jgi:hypothetical protein
VLFISTEVAFGSDWVKTLNVVRREEAAEQVRQFLLERVPVLCLVPISRRRFSQIEFTANEGTS